MINLQQTQAALAAGHQSSAAVSSILDAATAVNLNVTAALAVAQQQQTLSGTMAPTSLLTPNGTGVMTAHSQPAALTPNFNTLLALQQQNALLTPQITPTAGVGCTLPTTTGNAFEGPPIFLLPGAATLPAITKVKGWCNFSHHVHGFE